MVYFHSYIKYLETIFFDDHPRAPRVFSILKHAEQFPLSKPQKYNQTATKICVFGKNKNAT